MLHKVPISEVDEARDLLIAALEPYREYVDEQANGNATIISLGGFVPTKGSKSNVIAPVQPTGVTLVRGIQDELLAECLPITDADSYGAILTIQPLPAWFTINGLTGCYKTGKYPNSFTNAFDRNYYCYTGP